MSSITGGAASTIATQESERVEYEGRDLNEIMRKHLVDNVTAWREQLEYWTTEMGAPDLTAEEMRTCTLRYFDATNNIRDCEQGIELLDHKLARATQQQQQQAEQTRASAPSPPAVAETSRRAKRPRLAESEEDSEDGSRGVVEVRRHGYWKCRLCTSQAYLEAGPGRVPTAPCKYPLKDMSKLFNHFLEMHLENSPEQRCKELGAALGQNREYFYNMNYIFIVQAGS